MIVKEFGMELKQIGRREQVLEKQISPAGREHNEVENSQQSLLSFHGDVNNGCLPIISESLVPENRLSLLQVSNRGEEGSFLSRKSKILVSRINKQFNKMAKMNVNIKNYLRNIALQIKTDLLAAPCTPAASELTSGSSHNMLKDSAKCNKTQQNPSFQVLADDVAIGRSQFRQLLIPTRQDNDVESQEQDLAKGIGFIYGQLLYSVGEELVARRKRVDKKKESLVRHQGNKENQDFNKPTKQQNSKGFSCGQNFFINSSNLNKRGQYSNR